MIDVRKALVFAALLAGCASTPVPVEPASVSKFPVEKSQKFELQKALDYPLPGIRHCRITGYCLPRTMFFPVYDGPVWPTGRSERTKRSKDNHTAFYTTRLWNSPDRAVFGLDGPFRLENGKIPVFVCDEAHKQFYEFGGSRLDCPDFAGGPIKITLSEHHPHPDGLELAPGNMPKNRVPTKVYLWNDDGCIDQINANWETTAYCVPDGTALPTIWCEPYKP